MIVLYIFNAEIYHLGLAHIEHVYELDDLVEGLNNFEDIVAISDKDGSEFSTSGHSMKFVVWEVMNIEEVATLDDKMADFETNYYREVNKIIQPTDENTNISGPPQKQKQKQQPQTREYDKEEFLEEIMKITDVLFLCLGM